MFYTFKNVEEKSFKFIRFPDFQAKKFNNVLARTGHKTIWLTAILLVLLFNGTTD